MTTRRNDSLGWRSGARGIDQSRGERFTIADNNDMEQIFGRGWSHNGQLKKADFSPVDCDYNESADTAIRGSKMGKLAIDNFRPDLGEGASGVSLHGFKGKR
jgi:hypothetical protein